MQIPDVNNSGLVIIDFESWRPVFRQNWGVMKPYKGVSYEIEKERHPSKPQKTLEKEANEQKKNL
jgi:hyaluronoglucosaminidase